MSNSDASQALKAILGGGTVAFHGIFARAINVNCALMISQGLFWQENAKFREVYTFPEHGERAFFQKTAAEWHEVTGLSTEQQSTARELLVRLGIFVEKKAGIPAKLYFHIDLEALVSVVNQYNVTGLPVSVKAKSKFPGNTETKVPENPETVIGKNRKQYIGIESIESFDSIKESDAQSAFSPLSESESDYVKIQTWTAETEIIPLNIASLKQDTPGGGASPNQYSDTDAEELRRRDPLKKTIGRKPGSKTGAEIEKITQVMEYLNHVTGFNLKANSAAALKHIGARLKEGATVADMMRVIDRKAGEWLGTEMQQFLVPDTLFNKTKFEKYMQQLDMPLPVRQQTQNQAYAKQQLTADQQFRDKLVSDYQQIFGKREG